MSATRTASARWLKGADDDLVAAVCVARIGRAQFHAGLYHADHGSARVLHFAWDRDLCDDAPVDLFKLRTYGLIALSLDEDDTQTLCALSRRVARRHRESFRYRFAEWRPRFDLATAEVIPPPTDERYGFTCATFVLAMLRSAVVEEMLALEQWPTPTPDDTDDQWQKKLAKDLCFSETSAEGAAMVLAGIGARRILPTDVAGAAMRPSQHWPVGFSDSRREGEQISQHLL